MTHTSTQPAPAAPHHLWIAPGAFVVIWSTGFLVGRGVATHADPFWFLAVRFALVACAFCAAAWWMKARWPRDVRHIAGHLLAGALMSGFYLGPSWWAMARDMPAGVMSLIGALQPLFTALVAVAWLRQHLSPRTWSGLALGFGGVALVLAPKLWSSDASALQWPVVAAAVGSILSLTLGAMVQKSPALSQGDLRSASALQNMGATLVLLTLALTLGTPHWDHSPALWGYLAFAVGVLSIGGATLLIWLMRQGEATRTAALLLAVPPLAALEAWAIFGETLAPVQLLGFVLAMAGVALARR